MAGRLEGEGAAVTGPGSGIGYASTVASAWRGADAATSVPTDREQKDPGSVEDLFRRVADEPGTTVSVDGGLMQSRGQEV
ncbi:hypothetical protein FGU65_05590 [Methanoculleus sp. FWC-SCC1]|uniref:Uncharacterized protein n=1 Tax=Methanoculleus frigidifontis TaxID=2584085 RepID=A0ABT8M8V8_9EURY|nr:hypothetical protein [Methanoculleus sp. FWC-SCC1]MDN7024368.1 hypothetical protein [Methanoculleus sp. FWC-SCC1]